MNWNVYQHDFSLFTKNEVPSPTAPRSTSFVRFAVFFFPENRPDHCICYQIGFRFRSGLQVLCTNVFVLIGDVHFCPDLWFRAAPNWIPWYWKSSHPAILTSSNPVSLGVISWSNVTVFVSPPSSLSECCGSPKHFLVPRTYLSIICGSLAQDQKSLIEILYSQY